MGEREVCAGVLRAIVSGCLPAGGGCLWPPHVVRGHSARRGEVEHHSRAKDNAVRVCMVGGGGWGVGGGGGSVWCVACAGGVRTGWACVRRYACVA